MLFRSSVRQLRVGEELRHLLADLLGRGDLRDPALAGRSITVSEVRVSPDLRNATAFVIPLGGGDDTEMLSALRRAAPFLRSQVARAVRLRVVPNLSFQRDESFDTAQRIDDILHHPEVVRDLDGEPGEDGPERDRDDDGPA
ncbi:MAG: 30S ribosome-binding factor RbfA [Alphaproteobacteria bacterium]